MNLHARGFLSGRSTIYYAGVRWSTLYCVALSEDPTTNYSLDWPQCNSRRGSRSARSLNRSHGRRTRTIIYAD